MNCYLYVPPAAQAAHPDIATRLRQALDRSDVLLATNLEEGRPLAPDVLAASTERNEPALELMDAVVIEGTHTDADIGFLVAHAIALKKPTLYLYERGTVARVFSHLSLKELPAWIHVVSYHDRSLERHLEEFLLAAGGHAVRPSPRIKFTLRITNRIEDYLRFKTLNTKTSKADWVRDVLERLMGDDRAWQAHLRTRHETDADGEA